MSLPETYKVLIVEVRGQKPELKSVPLPKPGKNQVLVKMEYAPINPSDVATIAGHYPVFQKTPYGIGKEGSGVIAALGEDLLVPHNVGDKVHVLGETYGEYVLTKSEQCTKVKEGLSMELASCHTVNPFTAYYMADLVKQEGHKAAIHTAGSSALGKMLIRYFKHKGIKLINIVRRDEVIPELEKEGADYVLNLTKPDFEKQLQEIAEKEGATICFDAILGDLTTKVLRSMPNNSTIHIYGAMASTTVDGLGVGEFIFKNKAIKGLWLFPYVQGLIAKGEFLKAREEVLSLLPDVLSSPIQEVFPLEKFFEALEYNNKNSAKGKVLIKLN